MITYPNGEKYFGMYQKEFRNKQGIYVYQPKIEGDKLLSEFYFGVWRNNQKDDHGVYLWLSENKDIAQFSNFDDASFDCFTGDIDNETFSHKTYMKKKGNDYYLYHGGFNQQNEMNGDDCYFYNANKDELIYGKVRHNKLITGYIALFDEDGKLQHIMQCDFDDNGKITSYLQKEENEVETLGRVCNSMETFRNVILGEDYFGIVYNVFKKTKEYMDEKLNTLEAFDSSEEFPKLMSITFKFNEIKIYQNIEKNII